MNFDIHCFTKVLDHLSVKKKNTHYRTLSITCLKLKKIAEFTELNECFYTQI